MLAQMRGRRVCLGLLSFGDVHDETVGQSGAHEGPDLLGWTPLGVLCPLQNATLCGNEGSCWAWGLE